MFCFSYPVTAFNRLRNRQYRSVNRETALTANSDKIIDRCRKKIQTKLGLRNLPEIFVKIRKFNGPNKLGQYTLPEHETYVDESTDILMQVSRSHEDLKSYSEDYPQLFRDTDKRIPFEVYQIEPLIRICQATISGGVNRIIVGTLKGGLKYAAILHVETRQILRNCSLMTLLNQEGIKLSKGEKCTFIQTWHESANPFFLPLITPELSVGFVTYHGDKSDGESYEDKGYVHLRYYFDRRKKKNVRVLFKDGKEFQSPRNNLDIIDHLKRFGKNPGLQIAEIGKYR